MKEFNSSGEIIIQDSTITEPGSPVNKSYVDNIVPLGSFKGIGSPEGIVVAPVGSIYTDTATTNGAIRWIKTSGESNTGWVVEYGDTGLRNITPTSITSGSMLIRRINDVVTLTLRDAVFSYESLGRLPSGFYSEGIILPAKPHSMDVFTLYIFSDRNGYTAYQPKTSSDTSTLHGSVTYITRSTWPSTLPGTPA